jgi:hypothetical protein
LYCLPFFWSLYCLSFFWSSYCDNIMTKRKGRKEQTTI